MSHSNVHLVKTICPLMLNNNFKCSHSNLEKEYIAGMATGDYKCVDCGAVGWGKNWPKNEQNRKDDE